MVATVHPLRRRRFHGHHDPEAAARELDEVESQELGEAERGRARRQALYAAGRLIIAFVFIAGALVRAFNFNSQEGSVIVWLSIAVELIAGSLLALGLQA